MRKPTTFLVSLVTIIGVSLPSSTQANESGGTEVTSDSQRKSLRLQELYPWEDSWQCNLFRAICEHFDSIPRERYEKIDGKPIACEVTYTVLRERRIVNVQVNSPHEKFNQIVNSVFASLDGDPRLAFPSDQKGDSINNDISLSTESYPGLKNYRMPGTYKTYLKKGKYEPCCFYKWPSQGVNYEHFQDFVVTIRDPDGKR